MPTGVEISPEAPERAATIVGIAPEVSEGPLRLSASLRRPREGWLRS